MVKDHYVQILLNDYPASNSVILTDYYYTR